MALLVEAEMGEERKTDVELSIHRPNLYLGEKKKKNLVSGSFQKWMEEFSLPCLKKKKQASAVEVRRK